MKKRVEPRFFPERSLPALVTETPHSDDVRDADEEIRRMFDSDDTIYRSTSSDRPETVHYGQRHIETPPPPRRRRCFEEILTDEQVERIMPAWEQQFLPDWKERAVVRGTNAIVAHNQRAQSQGGPIFNPDTTMEIFPEELEGLRQYHGEAVRYRNEITGWALLTSTPFILMLGGFVAGCLLNVETGPSFVPIWQFLLVCSVIAFFAGLVGIFRTKYKYRHLDPTAPDPVRSALKGAAVTVAGAAVVAYGMHKLEQLDRT